MSRKISSVTMGTSNQWVQQMEFLLGRKVPKKYHSQLGRCFHLTYGNQGVLNALELMGLTIADVIYPEDRKVLRNEQSLTDSINYKED